jgi:hypothetical protein
LVPKKCSVVEQPRHYFENSRPSNRVNLSFTLLNQLLHLLELRTLPEFQIQLPKCQYGNRECIQNRFLSCGGALKTATQRGVTIKIRPQNLILGLFRDLPIIGGHEGGVLRSYQLSDFQPYAQLSRTILFRENVLLNEPKSDLRFWAQMESGDSVFGHTSFLCHEDTPAQAWIKTAERVTMARYHALLRLSGILDCNLLILSGLSQER